MVSDASGRFALEATLGEAVSGETSAGVAWAMFAGFWETLEQTGTDGGGILSSLGGSAATAPGSGKDGTGAGANWRRLEFGLEAGNRLAVPSIQQLAGMVPAGAVSGMELPVLRMMDSPGDGRLRFEAVGVAGSVWWIQARTDLGSGPWRTLNWIQLDGAGRGGIEVGVFPGDAAVLFRLSGGTP